MNSSEADLSPIIFDNTVLSNFALVQAFYILKSLYSGRAFVGQAVQREILTGIESASQSFNLSNRAKLQEITQALSNGWLQTPPQNSGSNDEVIELQTTSEYSKRFGDGESEAMAIARNRNWVFASDDGAARKFAREQGIRLTGSVGILVKAVQCQFLSCSLADIIHAQMIDEGYRSPLPVFY
ncbi:nuclease [Scytonema sp. UIC 10036]|uniref:nuclease n=1 Tax=Scytonema sp. UIC 10036 TaxID=2304196 RepID=UPI00325B9FBF